MQRKKVGYMDYKDGILYIVNGKDRMFFPCDDEFAGKIMDAVKKSYAEFYNNLRAWQEHMNESRKLGFLGRPVSKAHGIYEGYEEIGTVKDITVYVKCISYEDKLFSFGYYTDYKHIKYGSMQVEITMDIQIVSQ